MEDVPPSSRPAATGRSVHAHHVRRSVGVADVEESVLARSGLSRIDYVDHFVLTPAQGRAATAEQWARTLFGGVPTLTERFIWQCLLRLRLRIVRSSSTVAGWQIGERGPDWIRLESSSHALGAELVVRATEESLELTTLLRYDRADGRLVWAPLSAVHRRLAPGLLRDAVAERSAAGPA